MSLVKGLKLQLVMVTAICNLGIGKVKQLAAAAKHGVDTLQARNGRLRLVEAPSHHMITELGWEDFPVATRSH